MPRKRLLALFFILLSYSFSARAQTPAITAVLSAADYSPSIAQGSVFIVKGTNLSGAGVVQAPSLPLPTEIPGTGVKITFTPAAGGSGVDVYLAYTYNLGGVNQLAAILPSPVAPGSYNVTVTNSTAVSAAFKTTVVAHHFAVLTSDATGTGAAALQNFVSANQVDLNRFTTGTLTGGYSFSPAKPGQTLILYGTGMGPIQIADNIAPGAIDLSSQAPVRVIVGGESITPVYAGRSPNLPGTDQINFVLPSDVATGCTVILQVSVGGQLTNPATLAIAPMGANACVSPIYNTATLTSLDQGGSIVNGNFALASFTTKQAVPILGTVTAQFEEAAGSFTQYTGAQLASSAVFLNPTGSCQIYHRVGDQTVVIFGGSGTNLDAGTTTLNGPNVSNMAFTQGSDNSYTLSLGFAIQGLPLMIPGFNPAPLIVPGTYTIKGTGGKDVGPFNASLTIGTPLALPTPLPATVDRTQPLTISWTGGGPNDVVNIIGASGTTLDPTAKTLIYDAGEFICTTTAAKGSFTVPASILGQLPVTPTDVATTGALSTAGIGIVAVLSSTVPSSSNGLFSAALTAGGNIASGALVGTTGFLSGSTLFQ